jgi:hypothetical protein
MSSNSPSDISLGQPARPSANNTTAPARASRKRRTVISLDGIRTVAPPEQYQPPVTVQGLSVGAFFTGGDLPFQLLDEEDPILGVAGGISSATNKKNPPPASEPTPPAAAAAAATTSTASTERSDSSDDEYAVTHTGKNAPLLMDEETLGLEKEMLQTLDRAILKAEEDDLMSRLLVNIEHDGALQKMWRKPSLVTHVTTPTTFPCDERMVLLPEEPEVWSPLQIRIPQRRGGGGRETRKKARRLSSKKQKAILSVSSKVVCVAKRTIPKYADGLLLYSRGEFQTCVLDFVENDQRAFDPFLPLQVECVDHPQDPNSYRVIYRGPRRALDLLKTRAEDFIEYRHGTLNLALLLEDDESLELDVSINTVESLGARIGKPFDLLNLPRKQQLVNAEGVWMYLPKPDGALGKALGPEALEAGCALLALNDRACNSQSQLYALLDQARSKRGMMKLTLCLSKYADLSRIDRRKHLIRRRDGEPFDPDFYEDLRLERMLVQKEAARSITPVIYRQSWQEHPPDDSPAPVPLPSPGPLTCDQRLQAISTVLLNDQSIVVDLIIAPDETFGAMVEYDSKVNLGGVWCYDVQEGGQLFNILGKTACALGAVMMKANGVVVETKDQIKDIQQKARAFDGTFRVTLVLYDGTDLGRIDRSKLVQGRVNPRRRNGEPFPLHLYPLHTKSGTRENEEASKKKRDRPKKTPETEQEEQIVKKTRGWPPKKPSEEPVSKKSRDDETIIRDSASQENSSFPPKPPSSQSVNHFQSYNKFKDKYKPIIEIEYRSNGIHLQKGLSSMWAQHKLMFGDEVTCDDNCKCLGRILKLTKTVLSDFVEDQQKKGNYVDESSLRESTAGFVNSFAVRFLPLLKKEYPNSTPRQLIQRLVDMWPTHQKHRIYGVRCREECECDQAWELLFGKGDKELADRLSKKKKRGTSGNTIAKKRKVVSDPAPAATDTQRSYSTTALPRKPKPNEPERPSSLLGNYETSTMNSLPRKPKPSETERRPKLKDLLEKVEVQKRNGKPPEKRTSLLSKYETVFGTNAPLGAYFATESGPSGSKCKIHSVFERGQAKGDSRIHPGEFCEQGSHPSLTVLSLNDFCLLIGTIVDSVKVGSGVHRIYDHSDLKRLFDDARRTKSDLCVVFINSDVSSVAQALRTFDKDWSHSGNWQGKFNSGWPGGAGIRSLLEKKAIATVSTRTTGGYKTPKPSDGTSGEAIGGEDDILDEWKFTASRTVPLHRTMQPPKSALKVRNQQQSPMSVRFAKVFESQDYVPQSMASERMVKASQLSSMEKEQAEPSLSPRELLMNALENKGCKELVEALENGAASDPKVAESRLQEQYDFVRNMIGEVEKGLRKDPSNILLLEREKDLQAKKSVLKLYIGSSYWIAKAMSLQHWTAFEIQVRYIELRKTSSVHIEGRTNKLCGKVRIKYFDIAEDLVSFVL